MKTEYVLGFAFTPAVDGVVLVLKARPAWQSGYYNGVGGRVGTVRLANGTDGPETPFEAMVREFREETGVTTVESDWAMKAELNGPDFTVYVFSAVVAHRELKSRADEPAGWFHPAFLPSMMVPGVAWLVPLCFDKRVTDVVRAPYGNG